ncbi:MAG: YdcF family protein [Elusimicrobiota bacterium]
MFIFKKLITPFLLPPGIFVAALVWAAVYLRRRSRPGAIICAVLAGSMWISSTKVCSDALLRPLEYKYSAPAAPAGDVIVVLGGGAYDSDEVYSAGERLSPGSLERVSAAALLYKKTRLPVIFSGGAVFTDITEADAAGAYLEELGVPAKYIIKETQARDTYENALFTRRICGERGYQKIILLTSASHMPRSVYLYKKTGFTDIVPFPVSRTAIKGAKRSFRDYLPGNFYSAARALNEYLGLLFYRLAR